MGTLSFQALDQLINFVAEREINNKAPALLYGRVNPLWDAIVSKGRVNKGMRIEGYKAIIPVNMAAPTTDVTGCTDANVFVALTPVVTNGFDHAQYEFTRLHTAFWLSPEEVTLIRGDATRIDPIVAKTNASMSRFYNKAESQVIGLSNADSRDSLMGVRYAINSNNTVGGIAQGTYAEWQGGRTGLTAMGAFDPTQIDREIRRIKRLQRTVDGPPPTPDLLFLSSSSSNDVYGKLSDTIGSAQMLVTQDSSVSYGFSKLKYMGADVIEEAQLGTSEAGSGLLLSSESWYLGMKSEKPTKYPSERLQGTGAYESYLDWWLMFGCGDPAANSYFSGWDA